MMRRLLLAALAVSTLGVGASFGDYLATQGAGTTFFDFICFATKHCPTATIVNSAGTELATSGAPLRTDPTGTTPQPATQSGAWTVQPGNTANTTAWLVTGAGGTFPVTGTVTANLGTSGTFNNNADALATSSANGQAAAWLYGYNGTTWDRLRADTTNGLWVNVKAATGLAAGSTTAGQTGSLIMGAVTTAAPSYTTAQTNYLSLTTAGAARTDMASIAGTAAVADPCQTAAKVYTPINISTATTTRIIAPTAAKKTYICSMFLMAAGTQNVGIVEGTGGTCVTGIAGVIGGTTAATGPNLTAQVGFVLGSGANAVAATAGTNVDFCLITSAAVQLSGHVVSVAQ